MNAFRKLAPYAAPHRGAIAVGLACLLLVDLLQLWIPRVIKQAVDDLAYLRCTSADLLRYAGVIVLLSVMIGAFRFVWRHCLMGMSRKVEEALRNRLFSHLHTLSAAYFNATSTGDLMAHATNDIQQVRMAVGMGLVALTDAVVLGLTTIAFMAYIDWRLTLYVLVPMPLLIATTRFFSKRMHLAYQSVQAVFSDITETIRERLAGIRIVKAYALEAQCEAAVAAVSRVYIDRNLHLVRITGAFFPSMVFFTNVSLAAILYFGGRQTIFGIITPGDFVAFISYLGLLTWPMMALGWLINLVQRGAASMERLERIFDTVPDIRSPDSPVPFDGLKRAIHLNRVGVRYTACGPWILKHFSLEIPEGATLGIVGPPGGGKTTLLHLLPRLIDASSGAVHFDGIDIRELELSRLRREIAFVPQEPFLFAGTIRDNITLNAARPDAAALDQALEIAALRETVALFPKGLDTVAGERGVVLSGGQKQRIGLARAILNRRPVMLLDDPVSQVDTETADRIIAALRKLKGRHTFIIVSHRIPAVSFADRIIVMADGRITESGTHGDLLAIGGYYARTYHLQKSEG